MAVVDLRGTGRAPKSGKHWEVVYYDADRRRRTKRFGKKSEAESYERQKLEERTRVRGGGIDETAAKAVTVDQLHQRHMEALSKDGGRGRSGGRQSTLAGYESIHTNWISPTLGRVLLSELTRERVDSWRDGMVSASGKPPSARTRGVVVSQFSRLMAFGVDEGLLAQNLSKTRSGKLVGKPAEKRAKEHVYLTERQVLRLLAHARHVDPGTHDVMALMVSTGARFGEVSALTVDDFDPDSGDIAITKGYSSAHGRLILERTKSGEDRIVRVAGWVRDLVEDRAASKKQGELLFCGAQGAPLRGDNWRTRKFYPVVDRARTAVRELQEVVGTNEYRRGFAWYGPQTAAAVQTVIDSAEVDERGMLVARHNGHAWVNTATVPGVRPDARTFFGDSAPEPGDVDFPRLSPHDLRHTAVSIAIRRGADVKAVQAVAGHASAKITLDTYAGLFDEARDKLSNVLQDALMPASMREALDSARDS